MSRLHSGGLSRPHKHPFGSTGDPIGSRQLPLGSTVDAVPVMPWRRMLCVEALAKVIPNKQECFKHDQLCYTTACATMLEKNSVWIGFVTYIAAMNDQMVQGQQAVNFSQTSTDTPTVAVDMSKIHEALADSVVPLDMDEVQKLQCDGCHSESIICISDQKRRADEGMRMSYHCLACGMVISDTC